MDRVATLITCHNRKEKTVACLHGLLAQKLLGTKFYMDIFLVDDGSTDGTTAAVASLFPSVHILSGNGLLFWSRGMHKAWSAAAEGNFDYYIWVNDDIELFNSSYWQLLNCSKEKEDHAIICGSFQSQKTLEWTYGGQKQVGHHGRPILPTGKMEKCDFINGNCMLVPKYVYENVGPIDPFFIHAIGDFDYGLRARKQGISCYTTPAYLGYCERHISLPKWCLPQFPIRERINNLYSPLGNNHPYYYFVFEYRHFGIITAVRHYLSIHLRLLIPRLWIKPTAKQT